jgi:hypothetical protein
MLSRVAKPLLALIVLLAWLGLGDSARASFVIRQRTSSPKRVQTSAGFTLVVMLDEEESGPSELPADGTSDQDRSRNEGNPWAAPLPGPLLLAWSGVQTGSGAGSTSTSGPTSTPGGVGLTAILDPNSTAPPAEGANLLFLAEERFKPPPFASRLFRPPR